MPRKADALLKEAEQQLRDKRVELHCAVVLRRKLERQLLLLEQAALHETSVAKLLQTLASRALTLQQQLLRPVSLEPELTSNTISFDMLPARLEDYEFNDDLLQRVARMSPSDVLEVFQMFINRVQPLALTASCHGAFAPYYDKLITMTQQFTAFLSLYWFLAPMMAATIARCDCITGQQDCVPEGWYQRVANVLPLHQGFAELLQAACSSLLGPDISAGVAEVEEQIKLLRVGGVLIGGHLGLSNEMVGGPLASVVRRAAASLRFRVQIMTHVMSRVFAMPNFPRHTITMALLGCWPYSFASTPVLAAYMQRPDVQRLLAASEAPSDEAGLGVAAQDTSMGEGAGVGTLPPGGADQRPPTGVSLRAMREEMALGTEPGLGSGSLLGAGGGSWLEGRLTLDAGSGAAMGLGQGMGPGPRLRLGLGPEPGLGPGLFRRVSGAQFSGQMPMAFDSSVARDGTEAAGHGGRVRPALSATSEES